MYSMITRTVQYSEGSTPHSFRHVEADVPPTAESGSAGELKGLLNFSVIL